MSLRLGPLRQVRQPAADVDRAVAFYRDVLGLRLVASFGAFAFFDLDGVRLFVTRAEVGDGGGSVLYLAVPDIHAARRELGERGVTFEHEPQLVHRDDDGTFGPAGEEEWMAFFRDTEGNLLALASRERPAG